MNADIVVFGVPKGWSSSECDIDTDNYLGLFYGKWKPGTEFKAIRRDNKMFYVYLVHENPGAAFMDAGGRPGSFFGLAMIMDNQYVRNADKVRDLMDATYRYYVKNKLVRESENGARRWMVPDLHVPGDKIGVYVANGVRALLKANPDFKRELDADILPLPPIQNQMQRG